MAHRGQLQINICFCKERNITANKYLLLPTNKMLLQMNIRCCKYKKNIKNRADLRPETSDATMTQIIDVKIDIYLNDLAVAITLMNADINVMDKH